MATNAYEGMFIFDSGRFGRDPEAVSGEIARIVQAAGGEILVSRLWEERRLAYPIKGQKKGTYWLTYFRVAATQLSAIRRQCGLSEASSDSCCWSIRGSWIRGRARQDRVGAFERARGRRRNRVEHFATAVADERRFDWRRRGGLDRAVGKCGRSGR